MAGKSWVNGSKSNVSTIIPLWIPVLNFSAARLGPGQKSRPCTSPPERINCNVRSKWVQILFVTTSVKTPRIQEDTPECPGKMFAWDTPIPRRSPGQAGLAPWRSVDQNACISEEYQGFFMNRLVASILLILMIIGLLYSMYLFYRGRFTEGLFMYPLLAAVYVVMKMGGKKW